MSEEFDRRDWAEDLNAGIRNGDTWLRGVKILVLLLFLVAVRILVFLLAVFQFLHCLLRNRPNEFVMPAAAWLARYVEKVILFLGWNSNRAPFPFAGLDDVWEDEPDNGQTDFRFDDDEWPDESREGRHDSDSPEPPEEHDKPEEPAGGSGEEAGEAESETDDDRNGPPPRPDA